MKPIEKRAPDPGYYRVNYNRVDADVHGIKYSTAQCESKKVPDKTEPQMLAIKIKDPSKGFIDFQKQRDRMELTANMPGNAHEQRFNMG